MLEAILFIVIVAIAVVLIFAIKKIFSLSDELDYLKHLKASQSVKYGQLTEQWVPFSEKFPYDSQSFRFIGKPIDGIAFEDDKIVFVEFKTNTSTLTGIQKKIKELVEKKKVEWFELRVK